MSPRPDYVHCIRAPERDGPPTSLCGEGLQGFHFTSLDHWLASHRFGSRLVGCPECLAVVQAALTEEMS